MKMLAATLSTILATFVMFATPLATANDVSGAWKVVGDISGYAIDATMELKQDGEAVSGTIAFKSGAKPATLTGTVKDATVTLTFTVEAEEGTYDQTWTGTLGAAGVLKGTVDVQQGVAAGDFTATKQ
jgi:hypothetical protein